MLMLNIIRFTLIGKTIYISFAFLRDKKQPSYEKVLSFLIEIFCGIKLKRDCDRDDGSDSTNP